MLTFDEPTHTYRLDGEVIPSVTTLLSPLTEYAGIPKAVMEKAAERGNNVHKACEMFLWGTLDEDLLDEEYVPYLSAFKQFMDDTGFVVELIEERVFHKKLRYAGTVDLGGVFPGLGRRTKSHRAIIDIKTTFKLMRSVGPQLAGYNDAWSSMKTGEKFDERYALQLKKTGKYVLEPLKSKTDSNVFLSCLNIYNFMLEK